MLDERCSFCDRTFDFGNHRIIFLKCEHLICIFCLNIKAFNNFYDIECNICHQKTSTQLSPMVISTLIIFSLDFITSEFIKKIYFPTDSI